MRGGVIVLAALVLAGCTEPRLSSGGSVGQDGDVRASAGVDAGRVGARVNTDGDVRASADVVRSPAADVTVGVGTNGAAASVGLGNAPVRVGFGVGGWRIGW